MEQELNNYRFNVRGMQRSDIAEVAHIEAEIFSDAWSEKGLAESLEQETVKMIVAESPQSCVSGYVIFYTAADEGDIARIAVVSEYRRCGIADELLGNIWEFCQESGICRVLLEVRESNQSAIHLYEKHGFIPLGIRKNYYSEPLENGVIMEKQIDITTSI